MSVGWIGVVEVVEESRNGCIAWIAVLLLKAPEVERIFEEEVEGPVFGFEVDVEGASVFLLRSWTFIDAAEPGIRLTSVGALRKAELFSVSAAAALAGGFAAMSGRIVCGERSRC